MEYKRDNLHRIRCDNGGAPAIWQACSVSQTETVCLHGGEPQTSIEAGPPTSRDTCEKVRRRALSLNCGGACPP